jgi:nicotinate-nucleotide--dimethylbenzimidazole phosphoribosyltransferase
MTERDGDGALAEAIEAIGPLDAPAMAEAKRRLDQLTKPPGSLGRLEELVVTLAGITGRPDASVARRSIVVVAADHGVARQGVSAYPSAVTPQMVANFVAGGAAINALAAKVGASLTVVDVGVASTIPRVRREPDRGGRLVRRRIRDGTADITEGAAMLRSEARTAIAIGIELVDEIARREGLDILGIGEMGIANTTAASAVVATFSGLPAAQVTGRGTGVEDRVLAHKVSVVERSLAVNRPDPSDPVGVLAAVGGLEIAALVGLAIGAAARQIPVVLDGFITGAAALAAVALQPAIAPRLIASHRSPEPGHAVVLERLGLRPYLDLEMRLGEGTGASLLIGLLDAACGIRDEMATFAGAGVSGPTAG